MISHKTKMLCMVAITLAASGCVDGGGESVNGPQLLDDALITPTEVSDIVDASGGVATAVPTVSSDQMDDFVDNPLLTAIPGELSAGTSAGSSSYIANPLLN